MRLALVVVVVTVMGSIGGPVWADAARDAKARADYQRGATAYDAGDFATAYDMFKESFQLSHEPALLYNIASALQGLKRPHDAAEALRSYLRVEPGDSDRPNIERRIATLEEEQRILERDKPAPPPPPPVLTPQPLPPAAPILTTPGPAPKADRKSAIIAGCVVGGLALVAGGVVLGVVLGDQKAAPFTSTSLGAHPGTK